MPDVLERNVERLVERAGTTYYGKYRGIVTDVGDPNNQCRIRATVPAVLGAEGDASVRRHLLQEASIEIGAGLGPLAGQIWRVGLMGAGATPQIVLQFLAAFERALADAGYRLSRGAAVGAASEALGTSVAPAG